MEDLEIISAKLGVQAFTTMPDGWDYLTKNLSSPRGADWIYNNKQNKNRKQGLLINNMEKFKENKICAKYKRTKGV